MPKIRVMIESTVKKISGKEANSKKRRELVLRSKLCHLITSILHATITRIFS